MNNQFEVDCSVLGIYKYIVGVKRVSTDSTEFVQWK